MFLVAFRCTLDDLPVRLFPTKREAVKFIQQHSGEVSERIKTVLNMDASDPISLGYFQFGKNGLPLRWVAVRDFEDEQNEAA